MQIPAIESMSVEALEDGLQALSQQEKDLVERLVGANVFCASAELYFSTLIVMLNFQSTKLVSLDTAADKREGGQKEYAFNSPSHFGHSKS